MKYIMSLIKMNLKLLFRNKGFLFFLLITPIISTIILNLKVESTIGNEEVSCEGIIELESQNSSVIYKTEDLSFSVKCFDSSDSELSSYMLEQFARTGMYQVFRYNSSDMTTGEIDEQISNDGFSDRIGIIIYIDNSFQDNVFKGRIYESIHLYTVSDDERVELFQSDLKDCLNQINCAALYYNDETVLISYLESIDEFVPDKTVEKVSSSTDKQLSVKENNSLSLMGYGLAIITLGYLFCGVFMAYTVIEEKNNKVYMRILLSKSGNLEYYLSKLILCVIISLVQTVFMGVSMAGIMHMKFIINMPIFLLMIFLIGLIFSILSLTIGILVGDIMNANYANFAIWTLSSLLSGLYFSLDEASPMFKMISYLMPQRWFMKSFKLLILNDNRVFSMILYITSAYLIIIMCIGVVGLRIQHEE